MANMFMKLIVLFIFEHMLFSKLSAVRMSRKIITTYQGQIQGTVTTFPGSNLLPVDVYKGIQYATTYDNEMRFMPPTSQNSRWSRIYIADKFQPVCVQKIPDIAKLRDKIPHGYINHLQRIMQFVEIQKEDCLYLNIYVPRLVGNASSLLPVALFVHAESYEFGTGNAYDGSVLAAYSNIIVITINFRLGPFGFMTRGDGYAQGNYALLDIAAALHYVRRHIAAFGGDASKVTLMGQGHGAVLINLLLVSPFLKDSGRKLFQRAILQSGSALSYWALSDDPLGLTQELARSVNCSEFWDTSQLLLNCLKNRTQQEILHADVGAPTYTSSWGPVIDKRSVLTRDVRTLIERVESNFGDTDLMLGVMNNEGLLYFSETEIEQGISPLRKVQLMRTFVRNTYKFHRQTIYDVIWHEYSEYERIENPALLRSEVMDLLGDAQYIAPAIELADYHQHFPSATYVYCFNYPSRQDSYPRWAGGVHGDDLTYVFGAPLVEKLNPFTSSFTDSEKMLSEAIMTYWGNFIKTGNPNSNGSPQNQKNGDYRNRFLGVTWPEYNLERQEYLHIAKGVRPTILHHLRGSQMALWLELIPKLHKADDLEKKYHLLDDYKNLTLFDPAGVRPVSYTPMLISPPIIPSLPPSTISSSMMTSPLTTLALGEPQKKFTTKRKIEPMRTTPLPPVVKSVNVVGKESGNKLEQSELPLTVTVGVGCTLLFLNILIFVAVYYQKDKIKQERKAHERAINKEQSEHMIGSGYDGERSISGSDSDAGSSSYGSSPMDGAHLNHHRNHHSRHQQQQQAVRTHVSTLPLHQRSPIPVSPPLAPYNTLPVGGGANQYQAPNYANNIHDAHAYSTANYNNSQTNGNPPMLVDGANYLQTSQSNRNTEQLSPHSSSNNSATGASPNHPGQRNQNGGSNQLGPNGNELTNRRSLKRSTPVDEHHSEHPSTVV